MFALLTGSLMARTLAAICALLSITIMIAVLGAVYSTTQDARQALGERARLTVESLAGGASEALWNLDEAEATAVIGSLSRDPDYVGSLKFVAGNHLLTANLTRAAELIGSFKRVAVDQTSERRRAFDLATTVAEIVTMLRPTYKKTGHRIETGIPPGVAMDGYPGALGQVLTNLVTNAVLHAFDGRDNGVITIAITDAGAESVVLTVTDDGVGIPGEVLPRIFDSFFTTKLGSGGSGLGLHIAYATVTKVLGGRIGVESRPDVGTIFSIALPRRAPDHATAGERTADVAMAD